MQTVGLCCAASVAAAAFRGRPVNCSGIRASNKKAKNWSFESLCPILSLYITEAVAASSLYRRGLSAKSRRSAPFVESCYNYYYYIHTTAMQSSSGMEIAM